MPTRKDKTNVVPIYREQVFIPASGATLMKQKARPKIAGKPVSSGAIEIISPEFDLLTGARGLFNMIKPNKVYANIGNGSNMTMFDGATTTNEAVKQGIKEARDYVRHPVIVETVERNKELAERISGKPARNMGWFTDGNRVPANTRAEVLQHYIDRPVHIQTSNDLPKGFLGDYTSANTKIRVKSGLNPYDTKRVVFHEGLHHSGYGNFEGGLYDLKAEKLFGIDDYLLGHEAAVNTAELGRMMGLKLGQKYPGVQTFKDMIAKYNVDSFDKKFIFDKAILNTPRDYKRFWDALTGKYFTTAGAATTGLTLINTDKMKCGGRRKAQLGLDIREGGIAIPIAPNMYYMDGRSHDNGGIAIGPNNKNGLEVEGGEVVKVGNNDIKVFSSVPLLRGVSPAQLVMGGANPNAVFKAQEEFKDRNRINDDGTRYEVGGEKIYTPSKSIQRQIQETGRITIGGAPTIGGLRTFGYLRGLANARKYGAKGSLLFRAGKELIKRGTQKLVDNGKITKEVAQIPRSIYGQFVGAYGQNLPKTIGLLNDMEQKRFGGSKQDDTKTAALKHLRNKFTIRGNYNGGMFGGAGAGSIIMTQPEYVTDTITKKYLVPVTQNFNDVFRNARNSGQNEFMFDGKLYNTNLGNNPNNNAAGANRTSTIIIPIEHKEVRRRKKEFGGSMIYTINGNVKNGLSLRPKAEWGKGSDEKKIKNGDIRYLWTPKGLIFENGQSALNLNGEVILNNEPKFIDIAIGKQSNKRPQYYAEKQLPIAGSQSIAEKAGLSRSGWSYSDNPTFDYVPNINIAVPTNYAKAVGDNSKKSTSSTPRGEETKASKATTKSIEYPSVVRRDEYYSNNEPKGNSTPVDESYAARQSRGIQAVNEQSPSSTGGGTQSKDGRWVGQYKTTNVGDWIGLGSNLAGSIASYFMTKNAINKMPEPLKPIMTQAAKLKTRYNIEPQLTEIREAEQMNRAAVRRNTQSSNTSLAREQRLLNEARGARNTLYGQKENIETQLINQDRLNRQSVMKDNVRAYNEYLNRLTATKMAQNEMRVSNINNLISGLTGSVNNILGNIESRRATNNTLRAIAAANPNVDARLIGGFDYYIDPITKKKYNKNQQYVGTING